MQGAKVLADEPELFSEALLVEGGFTEFTPVVAGAWSKGGGKRALLACGIASCPSEWRRAEQALRQAGIESRVLDARTGRHNLDGEMMKALRAAFPWLVRDDPRWRAFVAARDAGAP
jgi:hypothetical protein